MSDDKLLAAAQAKRLQWVDLEPGKRVQIRRPDMVQAMLTSSMAGREKFEAYAGQVVAWEGFLERDLTLEPGADAPLDFSAARWRLLWGDKPEWLVAVSKAVNDSLEQYEQQREAAAKNSKPS